MNDIRPVFGSLIRHDLWGFEPPAFLIFTLNRESRSCFALHACCLES